MSEEYQQATWVFKICTRQHPIGKPLVVFLRIGFFCKTSQKFTCMSISSCKTGHKMEETVCKVFIPISLSGKIRTAQNTRDVLSHIGVLPSVG